MTPTESYSGVRFRMPGYYNELVCFELLGRRIYDDPDSARNRRRLRFKIFMRFNIVALVNAGTLTPVNKINVNVDEDTGLPIAVDQTIIPSNGS